MDTEDRLERYRDADTWPAERSLAAMLGQPDGGVRRGQAGAAGAGARG